MDKLSRPRGLIRYSSQDALEGKPQRLLRPRVLVYVGLVGVLCVGLTVALASRDTASVTILRRAATPFAVLPDGEIQNTIRLKLRNRTEGRRSYRVALSGVNGVRLIPSQDPLQVAAGEQAELTLIAIVPKAAFSGGRRRIPVTIQVTDKEGFEQSLSYRLVGPGANEQGTQ